MNKKVLFVFPSFGIGGTTVSTRNAISLLCKDGYDCWVMPLKPIGLLSNLYNDVPQVSTPFVIRALSASRWSDFPTFFQRMAAAILRFLRGHFNGFEAWVVGKALTKIIQKYGFDTIVAEQESKTSRFVSYASCKNKVAWVRCDYKRYLEKRGVKKENVYKRYNSIVCVAEQTCCNFKAIYPEYSTKTYCIHNPQDSDLIRTRANLTENEPRFVVKGKTLVSIGRLDEIKRFHEIAPIARQLVERGLQFRWYLIGDGTERERISESIHEYGMEDYVIMLGAKNNPYYYLQKADVFVCLSRSEACPRVVNEAKILHTPTISTDFPTIYEFIENEKTGIISPISEIHNAILRWFSDEELRNRIFYNNKQFKFDNTELIMQIENIL